MKKVREKDQCRTVKGLMETLEDVELYEKKGSKFYYKLHLTKEMKEASLDELDLSVRSSNCLRRAGYFKIGQLVHALAAGMSLSSIRNCGKTAPERSWSSSFCTNTARYQGIRERSTFSRLSSIIFRNNWMSDASDAIKSLKA